MSSISNFSENNRELEFPLHQSVQNNNILNKIIPNVLNEINILIQDSHNSIEKANNGAIDKIGNLIRASDKIRLGFELANKVNNKLVESYCQSIGS